MKNLFKLSAIATVIIVSSSTVQAASNDLHSTSNAQAEQNAMTVISALTGTTQATPIKPNLAPSRPDSIPHALTPIKPNLAPSRPDSIPTDMLSLKPAKKLTTDMISLKPAKKLTTDMISLKPAKKLTTDMISLEAAKKLTDLEKCEIDTFANSQEGSNTKINWDQDTVQFISDGSYPRIKVLQDGRYLLIFSNGPNIVYKLSTDKGDTWGEKVVVAHPAPTSHYNYTVPEFIELKNGTWVIGWNPRPMNQNATDMFQIKTKVSLDKGLTWSDELLVKEGGNHYGVGLWEPAFLELPNGELQLYFADESYYGKGLHPDAPRQEDQQISLVRSYDEGVSWGTRENISYRPYGRDGMPVPILITDKKTQEQSIVLSIEDYGYGHGFAPVTIRTTLLDNWSTGSVGPDSPKRDLANKDKTATGGAPYIDQFPNGQSVVSMQSPLCRKNDWTKSLMRVYIGDSQVKNFGYASTPFSTDLVTINGGALWNSITTVDDNTIFATSDIKTGSDDQPDGIYIVKGTVTRN